MMANRDDSEKSMFSNKSKLADRLINTLAALWYRLDRRHREIVRANLAFAYGPALSEAARECLAREVFRHFVRFP